MHADSLAEALASACKRWPDRPALVGGGRTTTFAELGETVKVVAGAYRRLGIERGDRILCSVSNRPEYIGVLGAAWTAGAVHVGVDHRSTGQELAAAVELTQATALLYEPPGGSVDSFGVLREVRAAHPELHAIVVAAHQRPAGCLMLQELATGPAGSPVDGPSARDPAVIFITSGTTGRPKATVGYHQNLSQRWRRLADWLDFRPTDVHLAQMPLSHGFGLMMAVAALLAGGRLVMVDRFSAEEALRIVETEAVTVLNGAPAHFKLLMSRQGSTRHNVHTLRLCVGTAAPFPPTLVESILYELDARFMLMYGSSEGVGVATTNREDILRGSVGRPAQGSVAIVGPDRQPLPAGETGEIAFSRDVYPVRYWGESGPEPPALSGQKSAEGAGWYHSGDLGRLDSEGRLYVLGRLKHQIDRGGLKVDPVEVEGALLRCPGVADAAVIGLPNPVLGESVCACVTPVPGQAPTLERLRTVLSGMLAPFKLPEELCLLDRIPRTRIGKLDLPELRAKVAATMSQRLMGE